MLTTKLLGEETVDALLESLQTPVFLRPTFEMIGAQLNTDLATYPPQRPPLQGPQSHPVNFTTKAGVGVSFIARARRQYRRTGTLGRSWTHDETVSLMSIQTALGNVTPYARYVQDEEKQADIHRDWWQTTKDVLEKREQWIVQEILGAIQSHVAASR